MLRLVTGPRLRLPLRLCICLGAASSADTCALLLRSPNQALCRHSSATRFVIATSPHRTCGKVRRPARWCRLALGEQGTPAGSVLASARRVAGGPFGAGGLRLFAGDGPQHDRAIEAARGTRQALPQGAPTP